MRLAAVAAATAKVRQNIPNLMAQVSLPAATYRAEMWEVGLAQDPDRPQVLRYTPKQRAEFLVEVVGALHFPELADLRCR